MGITPLDRDKEKGIPGVDCQTRRTFKPQHSMIFIYSQRERYMKPVVMPMKPAVNPIQNRKGII